MKDTARIGEQNRASGQACVYVSIVMLAVDWVHGDVSRGVWYYCTYNIVSDSDH